jgi:hypothetical protein
MTYFTDHITQNTIVQSPTTGEYVSFGSLSATEQQTYISNDQTFEAFQQSHGVGSDIPPTTADTSGVNTQVVSNNPATTTAQDATTDPNTITPDPNTAVAPDFSPISVAGNQLPGESGAATQGGVQDYSGPSYAGGYYGDQTETAGGGYDPTEQDQSLGDIESAQQDAATSNPFSLLADQNPDWRVKLSLAPASTYLYNRADSGILYPLSLTNGVIFPYMPHIETSYNADYETYNLAHTNYTGYFYKSSHVGAVNISGDFTAQTQSEADYLLAVIHFFRSVTKMFYGQDQGPVAGTPPPICYLNGLGNYQFNNMPVLVSNFSYNLPENVDYVRAGSNQYSGGQVSLTNIKNSTPTSSGGIFNSVVSRLTSSGLGSITSLFGSGSTTLNSVTGLQQGGAASSQSPSNLSGMPTYVPTKMTISVTLLPVVSRNRQATIYSTQNYATGSGIAAPTDMKGGFW